MANALTTGTSRSAYSYTETVSSGGNTIIDMRPHAANLATKPATLFCEKQVTVELTSSADPDAADWFPCTELSFASGGTATINSYVTGIKITDASTSANKIAVVAPA